MYRKPLRDYPPATLYALTGTITALLGYEELIPADLYVKLDLLRDDMARATRALRNRGPHLPPVPGGITPDD
jgi:hypothetical protein